MRHRPLPPTGGGPPLTTAGGRAVSARRHVAPAPISLSLSVSVEAETAGRDVITRIRDACSRDDIELIASILVLFPSIAPRMPDFHALMDELVREQKQDVIAKILRVPGKRGPKRQDEFELVALIEHVMQTEIRTDAAD